jgi:hypothetical protein
MVFLALQTGTALTTDRRLFDEGIESLAAAPAVRELRRVGLRRDPGVGRRVGRAPSCVRRIAVRPKGAGPGVCGLCGCYQGHRGGARYVWSRIWGGLAGLDLDESATVCEADAEPFLARLQALADAEFRLTTHVANVEADNQQSGRAQAALALGTAYGFIAGRQKLGSADANFWKELDACRRAGRGAHCSGRCFHRTPGSQRLTTKLLRPSCPSMSDGRSAMTAFGLIRPRPRC